MPRIIPALAAVRSPSGLKPHKSQPLSGTAKSHALIRTLYNKSLQEQSTSLQHDSDAWKLEIRNEKLET
jgi:hypothetical protein